MKKTLIILSFLLLLGLDGFSKQRIRNEALDIAGKFIQNKLSLKKSGNNNLVLAYECKDELSVRSTDENIYYYVFNIEGNNGFVIVSGDDRANEILGYSDKGSFDLNMIPANFEYWLSNYEKEIKELKKLPEDIQVDKKTTGGLKNDFADSLEPLLGNIKWDQGSPYNDLCPVIPSGYQYAGQRTAVGCVATAMAQVMKYHEWPIQGKGQKSYVTGSIGVQMSANFGATTYDWENMTDTYNSSSTEQEKLAVATLMLHCGISVNMNYYTSSGAMTYDVLGALVDYFDYDPNCQLYERDYYEQGEWENMVKAELNQKRPVLYTGRSLSAGGHAFVCDGYDTNGLFHFNWGWSGMSDGYFRLSALNPSALGIGGGGGGFNVDQSIILGVQKPDSQAAKAIPELVIYSTFSITEASVRRSETFSPGQTAVFNLGFHRYTGNLGFGLYDDEDNFICMLYSINASINPQDGGIFGDCEMVIPTEIANGNYKIYPVYSVNDELKLIRSKVGTSQSVNVEVTTESVNFSRNTDKTPQLELNAVEISRNFYVGKTAQIEIDLTNSGTGEYNSNILIYIQSKDNNEVGQYLEDAPINLLAGEKASITIRGEIELPAGEYILYVMYDPNNNRAFFRRRNAKAFSGTYDMTVKTAPLGLPKVELLELISFADNNVVPQVNAELTMKVKNTQGYYEGRLIAFFYDENGNYADFYIASSGIILDKDEEKEVKILGNIDLAPGKYSVLANYITGTSSSARPLTPAQYGQIEFTLVAGSGLGISDEKAGGEAQYKLYPNPATDRVYLETPEPVKSVRIINILGKVVMNTNLTGDNFITIDTSNLPSGNYIFQWITDSGAYSSKFIRK